MKPILILAASLVFSNIYAVKKRQLQLITTAKISQLTHTNWHVIQHLSRPPKRFTLSIKTFKQQEQHFHVPQKFIKKTR